MLSVRSRAFSLFLSTLSLRRATFWVRSFLAPFFIFLSTLSLRRATIMPPVAYQSNTISIHALLAESDQAAGAVQFQIDIFLSTLSLRRATSDQSIASGQYLFLSTLSLRRATVSRRAEFRLLSPISIHALLAESDLIRPAPALPPQRISIHALLAESDGQHAANRHRLKISIHALLAESDPSYSYTYYRGYLFLSTLSLRRATTA